MPEDHAIPSDRKPIFLVHGRHVNAREQMISFLGSLSIPVLTWREASSLTGEATPSTMDIVGAGIETAQCSVVLLTGEDVAQLKPHFGREEYRSQPRPNVIFEIGWSLATLGTERTLLITLGSVDLLSDIDGLNYVHLDNSPEKRRLLVSRLETAGCLPDTTGDAWLEPKAGGDFEAQIQTDVDPDSHLPDESLGGLFTEWVVDSALNLQLSHAALMQETKDAIKQHRRLDLKHHYVGTRMAEWWENVCKEPSYGHTQLTDLTTDALAEMLDEADLKADASLDVISLGPGDGKADVAFLTELQKRINLEYYYLVDISLDLLHKAVNAVVGEMDANTKGFRMKAILADFENNLGTLEPFFTYNDTPNLYLLTGFTLGNAKEDATVEALLGVMRKSDVLLVDARLHKSGNVSKDGELTDELKEQLVVPYSSEAVKAFAFGPVQVASDFAIKYQDIKLDYDIHVGRTTSVPAGINVFLKCPKLDRHPEFENVFGSKGRFGRRPLRGRDLHLATVTYYDYDSLTDWFVRKGFNVVWREQADDLGLFLLRPRGD